MYGLTPALLLTMCGIGLAVAAMFASVFALKRRATAGVALRGLRGGEAWVRASREPR